MNEITDAELRALDERFSGWLAGARIPQEVRRAPFIVVTVDKDNEVCFSGFPSLEEVRRDIAKELQNLMDGAYEEWWKPELVIDTRAKALIPWGYRIQVDIPKTYQPGTSSAEGKGPVYAKGAISPQP